MSVPDPAPHVFRKEGTADFVTAVDPVAAASGTEPDRYDFVLKHDDTQGRFSLVDMLLSPVFDSNPGHRHHEHSETFYVIDGQLEWTVDGETHVLGSGDTVFIPPFAHHIARVLGGETARMLLIWEPAGWEAQMTESSRLTAEQRANAEFMAEFRVRGDTYP
jgi:mannose-6-phosphate isomerase-like protein (cupin superfamily)